MSIQWSSAEILTNPQTDSLRETMSKWEIVEIDDKGNVKINIKNPNE